MNGVMAVVVSIPLYLTVVVGVFCSGCWVGWQLRGRRL